MKFLGTTCQRPYAWIYVFEVNNEDYAVCATLWDDTLTEDSKMWDIYQLGLYRAKKITYNGQWKHMIDNVDLGEKLNEVQFNFYDTFGKEYKRKYDKELTDAEAHEYLIKENKVIFERLIKPYFPEPYHKELNTLLSVNLT